MEDCPKCRKNSSDTPTVSEYQHVSFKTFQYSSDIEDPNKFPTYKTQKNLVLIGLYQIFSIVACVGKRGIMISPSNKELLFLILTHTQMENSQRRQYVPTLYRKILYPLRSAPKYQEGIVPLPTTVNIQRSWGNSNSN